MNGPREHLLVRASAGSGKTYRLVRRLIGLLADGERPDTILAATFSRKAAGEFRIKLLDALAAAAEDRETAAGLAGEIGRTDRGKADFRDLLGKLARDPDALRLSTIDAFFLELAGLFRLEFGLGSRVRLTAETAENRETRELLRRVFASSGPEIRQALFHQIEEIRGEESVRGLQAMFESWIETALSLYRSAPQPEVWGRLPEGVEPPEASPETWSAAVERLREALAARTVPPENQTWIEEVLESLRSWDFSPNPPPGTANWLSAGARDAEKLLAGKKYFQPRGGKRFTLDGEAGAALVELSKLFHGHVLRMAVRHAKGARLFLERFEREYEDRKLREGNLRFADLPFLLARLSTVEDAALAYRLDASLRHWLLDEFQDTSRPQWRVLEPFVEELFYDAEGGRTFFCVGDPKQAIYGWREGDSRLFEEIRERFGTFEPRPLRVDTLAVSYRCAPAIVAFVNRLFGRSEAFPTNLDPVVVGRWMEGWEDHRAACDDPPGRVEATAFPDDEAREEAIVSFFRDREPSKTGETAAILCRKNDSANRFEALLRAAGIPTVRDGALRLSEDFTVGRVLRGIFRVLAHPGDSLALGFLRDAETAPALECFCGGTVTPARLRSLWEEKGLSGFLAALGKALSDRGWIDGTERRCLRAAHSLLAGVLSSPDPGPTALEKALREARIEDAGSAESVQVLTIHRSKGLEFDVVVLPDLDDKGGGGGGRGFWQIRENGEIVSVLESVNQDVQAAFPRLARWAEDIGSDRALETLCVHYVAFTRARKELHLFLGNRRNRRRTGIHAWIEQAFDPGKTEGLLVEIGESRPPAPAPEGESGEPGP